MPAYAKREEFSRPRERVAALTAVVVVQIVLAAILLRGLRVETARTADLVQRLVNVSLIKPPSPLPPLLEPQRAAAPRPRHATAGGVVGPQSAQPLAVVKAIVPLPETIAPPSGGTGGGSAAGAGLGGGGNGDAGDGAGGGSDLEQIAGEITPRDYPRELRNAGIGGVVGFIFRVEPTGRVSLCRIMRSSGVAQLDALTCRLVQKRFVYRPSTDRNGRPVADEVEGEHEWIARPH